MNITRLLLYYVIIVTVNVFCKNTKCHCSYDIIYRIGIDTLNKLVDR